MFKKLIGIIGILLFLAGIYLFFKLQQDEKLALSRDDKKTVFGSIEGPSPCNWNVVLPERVMTEEKSQAIVVKVNNKTEENCESAISLRSPGFDISPARDEQLITLNKGKSGALSWIITPRKSGTFEIAVSDALDTKIFGITVTNIFGLNALQVKIASLLGGLFGPMLTIPWWWDRLRGKKTPKVDFSKQNGII